MSAKCTKSFSLIIFLFLLSFLVFSEEHNKTERARLLFYNPESNINNFVSLKISYDSYLSKFGDYRFQPFNKKELFEKAVLDNKDGVYLLSSWHFYFLRDMIDLQPILVGVLKGRSTQKKILTVKNNITDIAQLKGKTIACSGSAQYTRNILKEVLGGNNVSLLKTFKLILVPKDIDALMAVSFGMASAALTTERSLDNLAKINYKQYQSLKPLMASRQHYLALAALSPTTNKTTGEIIDILEKMGIHPEGETRLSMLGLDGWRRLSRQEQRLLKQPGIHGL
ncbi:MAG: hypothetical protein KAT04_04540 [Methylococcales bacterium]|nr:hypothetical protein [Methylococcales bacterium]